MDNYSEKDSSSFQKIYSGYIIIKYLNNYWNTYRITFVVITYMLLDLGKKQSCNHDLFIFWSERISFNTHDLLWCKLKTCEGNIEKNYNLKRNELFNHKLKTNFE